MKNLACLILALSCITSGFCQKVGIGTNTPNALLELYDSTSSGITNVFLVRSGYKKEPYFQPIGTVLQVSNNGNVNIGSGYGGSTGIVDIYGKMGDSVLLNLHGAPTMIFGSDAVLRFSGAGYFDIGAHFLESGIDNYLSIGGKLKINRVGAVIIGGQPNFGYNANSLTINHNAAYEQGVPLALTEYANQIPLVIRLQNYAPGMRNWDITSYAAQNSDSSYISFKHFGGLYNNSPILFTGSGKLGVNATEIASQAQVQINGRNNPNNTPLLLNNVQEYQDNAEALAAGLPAGAIYRTGDVLKIVH